MDKKSRDLVMAKLYFKNKDYRLAEKSFNEYLSINPEDVSALKLLAQVHEQGKRFDKAFEMYERCYLAEPDRTGTLLDICRILLMNEVWLEHVDYRKWLNLAIKAFPSNPIVVNFKAFLSTLPAEEPQASPKREPRGEDPLLIILEKLSTIEKKIDTLFKMDKKIEQLSTMEKKIDNIENLIDNLSLKGTAEKTEKAELPIEPTPPVNNSFSFSSNLFSESMKKFNVPSNVWATPPPQNPPKPSEDLQKSNIDKVVSNGQLAGENKSDTTPNKINDKENQIKPNNLVFGNLSSINTSPATSTFSFASTIQPTDNLFADSLKKFNIPTSVWSTPTPVQQSPPKPKEDDEGGDNDERVPNEELEIENTCDMTPIEIKTGEENEDVVFEHRCKLFRFRDKEYKERGLGSIKVLKHKSTGKGRLIMRREAIGLVCLNCWDCSKVERVRETQVRWSGIDASDGDPQATIFLAKFKTEELTNQFESHLTALFSDSPSSTNTSMSSPFTNADTNSAKPDVELIDPQLNQSLVDKARALQLPDLFYHKLKNQDDCKGCDDCKKDDQ